MFSVKKVSANRLDITISGKLDSEQMRVALDTLIDSSENIQNGKMLYRITAFDLPTLGALGVEFSRAFSLLKLVRRFSHVALIADKSWVRAAGEFEGAVIPGLAIKGFEPGEEAAAEAWLAESEPI